jgi:phasin family protein
MDSLVQPSTSSTFNPSAMGQRNMEAMLKFGRIWTTGLQDISKTVTAAAQAHLDDAFSNWKALSQARSLTEAVHLQTDFARASLEKAVADTSTLTTASMKLAEASLTPITAWMTSTTERYSHTGV